MNTMNDKTFKYEDLAFHQYCRHCGMDIIPIRQFTYSYDSVTGNRIKHTIARCINWRWWKPMFSHFNEEFDEDDKMVTTYDY